MRIISGTARGWKLAAPKGDRVRPTTDRVRESLFSILGSVHGLAVVDGFAGTGALGCEALSRGAASCVFVDVHRDSVALVRENVGRTGVEGSSRVIKGSFPKEVAGLGGGAVDLVFLDPPYGEDALVAECFEAMARAECVGEGALVVLEQEAGDALPEHDGFVCEDTRAYGRTRVTLWRVR